MPPFLDRTAGFGDPALQRAPDIAGRTLATTGPKARPRAIQFAQKTLASFRRRALAVRSWFGPWRSLVAHLHGVQGVVSSSLTGPTNLLVISDLGYFLHVMSAKVITKLAIGHNI